MATRSLQLGVAEFALPAPKTGSIEMYSGYGPFPQVGQEFHLEIQAQRLQEFPHYVPKMDQHTFAKGKHA